MAKFSYPISFLSFARVPKIALLCPTLKKVNGEKVTFQRFQVKSEDRFHFIVLFLINNKIIWATALTAMELKDNDATIGLRFDTPTFEN